MFLTINVNEKSGEGTSSKSPMTTQLQRALDNRTGNLAIALIEFNYVIGYHNITPENAIVYYIDEANGLEKVGMIPEGLYDLSMYEDALKDIIGREVSNIFIDSVDTRNNYADGKFSMLFTSVPCSGGKFGDYITHIVVNPLFKRLCNGYISELNVTVNDENDSVVQSNQPMTFVFEVRESS